MTTTQITYDIPTIYLNLLKSFQESEHPRDAQGRFTSKGKTEGFTKLKRLQLKESLKDYLNRPIFNKETKTFAYISTASLNKMTSDIAIAKSKENGFSVNEHFEVCNNIVNLFEQAHLIEIHKDKHESPDILSIKRFGANHRLTTGKKTNAYITVKEIKIHGNKIYSVELLEIKTAPSIAKSCDERDKLFTPARNLSISQLTGILNPKTLKLLKSFIENEHPRDAQGRFTSKAKRAILKDHIDKILNASEAEKAQLKNRFFKIANTPKELKEIGLTGDEFSIRYGVISRHKSKDTAHNLSVNEWCVLCDKLENADNLVVTKYNDDFNIYMRINESVLIGVKVQKIHRNLEVNSVRTVFKKEILANAEVVFPKGNNKKTPEQEALLARNTRTISSSGVNKSISQYSGILNPEILKILKSFIESEHPRDAQGRFTSKGEQASSAGKIKKDFSLLSGILKTGVSASVHNKDLGEIVIDAGKTGKSGYGLKHIIEQRYKKDGKNLDEITSLIPLVIETARNGAITRSNNYIIELSKNGIIAILRKESNNRNAKWLLTGFDDWDKQQEATGAIKTVTAKYGYAPEFSRFRKQVGAVIASLNTLSDKQLNKSITKQSENIPVNIELIITRLQKIMILREIENIKAFLQKGA
ncbi:MAG: hypothetical protein GX297_04380 [Treponema sp.]|nr:hypothetical protein [Treponema sp.]